MSETLQVRANASRAEAPAHQLVRVLIHEVKPHCVVAAIGAPRLDRGALLGHEEEDGAFACGARHLGNRSTRP
eukprot:scaffold206130_cov31-Tisochrysis_lutea.AAC.2